MITADIRQIIEKEEQIPITMGIFRPRLLGLPKTPVLSDAIEIVDDDICHKKRHPSFETEDDASFAVEIQIISNTKKAVEEEEITAGHCRRKTFFHGGDENIYKMGTRKDYLS